MRTISVCALMLAVAVASAAAQSDKKSDIDTGKLVGRWGTTAKGRLAAMAPVEEFTKDGKYTLGPPDGKLKLEGTYKIEGNTVTITLGGAQGVPAEVHKREIKKLTDSTLTYMEGKQTVTLAKVK